MSSKSLSSKSLQSKSIRVRLCVVLFLAVSGWTLLPVEPATADQPARVSYQSGASRQDGVSYQDPVEGIVVDAFRPPANPYSVGNRGLEYMTVPGAMVDAAGDGEVVFAGLVAGTLHVTVLHSDGLRTSYSFLETLGVSVGQLVTRGDPLGTSGPIFHFGVRAPDGTYLDPASLLNRTLPKPVVRLVPGADEGLETLASLERSSFLDLVLKEGARMAGDFLRNGVGTLALAQHYVTELQPETHIARIAKAMGEWALASRHCTPAGVSPPPPSERRIVIEVAGLGSTSEDAAIARLDTQTLGYADADVVRFSYSGGRVPATGLDQAGGDLSMIPVATYTAEDTQIDMRESAERLARLVEEVSRLAPGVPIDVVAHSQGGVVARIAIDQLADSGQIPSEVENLVTLSSPHQGSDVATAVAAARTGDTGRSIVNGIQAVSGMNLDPDSVSIAQLSETSELNAQMAEVHLPESIRFTSIGARGDLIVPAPRTVAPGANHAVVPLVGPKAHDSIPSADATTREVSLAVAGLAPTCVGVVSALTDAVTGEVVSGAEDFVGLSALTINAVGTPLTPMGPVR